MDDNEHVCEAVRLRLEVAEGVELVGQLASAAGVLDLVARTGARLVIMDIDMPGPDPFETVARLRVVAPECRVVMLTGHVQRDLIDRALDAGAWGYLSKEDHSDAFIDALKRVAAGEVVLGKRVEAIYANG